MRNSIIFIILLVTYSFSFWGSSCFDCFCEPWQRIYYNNMKTRFNLKFDQLNKILDERIKILDDMNKILEEANKDENKSIKYYTYQWVLKKSIIKELERYQKYVEIENQIEYLKDIDALEE